MEELAARPLMRPAAGAGMQWALTRALAALLALAAALPAETWRFLPCFHKDVRGIERPPEGGARFHDCVPEHAMTQLDGCLAEDEARQVYWHPVEFPHRDFVRLMPEERVFGWYGCEFDVPSRFAGMDALLDLGIIDDSDETFVNGVRVGAMGRVPNGSAWQADRLYRVPAPWLTPFCNYLAVHVWSLWGLGGIAGPPVLMAAIAPRDARWETAFLDDTAAPVAGLNAASTLEEALGLFPAESLHWSSSSMPWKGLAVWKEGGHYAIFRLVFELVNDDGPRTFDSPVVLDMGPVFDAGAFFLNGMRLGMTGRFPEDGVSAFTETAHRARFLVPPGAWSADGSNELHAIVYRERGVGGLPGIPGMLLENPLDQASPGFGPMSEAFDILLQSGDMDAAGDVLDRMRPESDTEKNWELSHRAHLAFLKWLDGGGREPALLEETVSRVADIMGSMPETAPRQSAMQAFCRVLRMAEGDGGLAAMLRRHFPSLGESIRYIGEDRATRGDWPLHYGRQGYALAAMGQLMDISSPLARYSLRLPVGYDRPRLWLDPVLRRVSAPYSHGPV